MNDIGKFENKLTIEKSVEGKRGFRFNSKNAKVEIPQDFIREKSPKLPQLSEFDVVRHYTKLSKYNFSVDTNFYPLGSCTMKYNPRINEEVANFEGFTSIHPLSIEDCVQGTLEIIYETQKRLCELCGFNAATLWPVAGAHGEFTGILIIKKRFENLKDQRDEIIVPDSAHGTNPASVSMGGFKAVNIASGQDGRIDLNILKQALNPKTAAIMLTIPNTLGIFESRIKEICNMAHKNGTLVYMDGANMNALIGLVKPGDFGVDILHLNFHKTFSAPHGGGGPGGGAILVKKDLEEYLPIPIIVKNKKGKYILNEKRKNSIGRIKAYFTNTQVLLKAFAYLLAHGPEDFQEIAENSIINANYVKSQLQEKYPPYSKEYCMHECVLTPHKELIEKGIKTLDIAKRLLDYGFHAPTIYFPLTVQEAIMIEPTETESKETLDSFIETMLKIYNEAIENPQYIKDSPHTMPVKRLDEVQAARKPNIKWE